MEGGPASYQASSQGRGFLEWSFQCGFCAAEGLNKIKELSAKLVMLEENLKQLTEAKNTDLINVASSGGTESAQTLIEGRNVKSYAQAVGRPSENRRQGSPCSSDNGKW